jgi:glucokinase
MGAFDYLLADIGATNTRVVLATPDGAMGEPARLRTANYATGADLLNDAIRRLGIARPGMCWLAVAGPVESGTGHLTNGSLAFDEPTLARAAGCPVRLINDFHALARALPVLRNLRALGEHANHGPGANVKAVIGPGTGLGMGALLPVGTRWLVMPSEGGHADLAPGPPLEAELLRLLQHKHGHVAWETVLCGPGLVRLYQAVCAVFGAQAEEATPEWVTARGTAADDPICHQTLEVFFGLLGAAAGNLALTVCARGGVYVAGGIVPRLADFAAASALRSRFDDRGDFASYVRTIPLYLVLDEEPGLIGALECLRDEIPR